MKIKKIFIIALFIFYSILSTNANTGNKNLIVITNVGVNKSLVEKYALERKVISVTQNNQKESSIRKGNSNTSIHGGITSVGTTNTTGNIDSFGNTDSVSRSNSVSILNANANSRINTNKDLDSKYLSISYKERTTEGYSLLRVKDMLVKQLCAQFDKTGYFNTVMKPDIDLTENEMPTEDLAENFPGATYIVSTYIADFLDVKEGRNLTDKRTMSITAVSRVYNINTRSCCATVSSEIDLNNTSTETNVSFSGGSLGDDLIAELAKKLAEDIALKITNDIFKPMVVSVSSDKIYINRELKIGTVLEIKREGEKIIDMTTGRLLGTKQEKIGIVKVSANIEKASECIVMSKEKEFKVSDIFIEIDTSYAESGSKREIAKINQNKEIREKLILAFEDEIKANKLIKDGQLKLKKAARLENADDYVAGSGTTLARHVSRAHDRQNGRMMRKDGEKMIEEGEQMLKEISALKQQVRLSCEKISLTSTKGKSLVCIVLKYELDNIFILVGTKLYSIKESSLSEESKMKIASYKY